MNNYRYDRTDEYYISVFDKMLKLLPVTGLGAAVTLTLAYYFGNFQNVSLTSLICFDLICLTYVLDAYIMRRVGIVRNGIVSEKAMQQMDFALTALIVLQWNLISYLFPERDFWGFAPMFAMLSAYMFHTYAVKNTIIGLGVSIALSWFIRGDALLPVRDEHFNENLILRIVGLIISFGVIYVLTNNAEQFTRIVKENFSDLENKTNELEKQGRDIIDFTADLIEERDVISGSHTKRLKALTRILTEELAKRYPDYGLDEKRIDQICRACVLHDVGKIGIPDSILNKPGKLTAEEFDVIKTHTTIGARIIEKLPESVDEQFRMCCQEICQFHHEKYDGKGYPNGLKGEDIPIAAQIVSMVDCYDALISDRPYKSALPSEVAVHMICNGECGAFSDRLKECLVACYDKTLAY